MERQRLLDGPAKGRYTTGETDTVFDSKWYALFVMETVVRKWLAATYNRRENYEQLYTLKGAVCMSQHCGNLDSSADKDRNLRFFDIV
jgi:hypothetical protein